jgi:hypothetical protein
VQNQFVIALLGLVLAFRRYRECAAIDTADSDADGYSNFHEYERANGAQNNSKQRVHRRVVQSDSDSDV